MEMSRQRSSRDVLLIWLVELHERVKRVDSFVRDTSKFWIRNNSFQWGIFIFLFRRGRGNTILNLNFWGGRYHMAFFRITATQYLTALALVQDYRRHVCFLRPPPTPMMCKYSRPIVTTCLYYY